jgi:PAS domain S-box-containing protein
MRHFDRADTSLQEAVVASVAATTVVDYLHAIQVLTSALGPLTTIEAVADAIFAHILPVTQATGAILSLLNEDDTKLSLVRLVGHEGAVAPEWNCMPLTAAFPLAVAVRENRTLRYESRAAFEVDYPDFASLPAATEGARLAFPLRLDNRVLGGIGLVYSQPREFADQEILFVETVGLLCSQALERARRHEEEQRFRQRLEAERERLQLTHHAVGIGPWEWDVATNQVIWSPEYRAIYGLPMEGTPSFELGMAVVLEEDRDAVVQAIQSCLHGGNDFHTEHRIQHPTRGLRWVSALGKCLSDAQGRPVRLVGIVWDSTERHDAVDAMRQREERYRALVASTSSILWAADADGRFVQELPSWQARTGQTFDQYRGWGRLDAIHPDDRERVCAAWIQAITSRQVYRIEERVWNAEIQAYRWYAVCGVPVLNADGAVREWVGTMEDIHEQKLANLALSESEERLRAAVEGAGIGTSHWDIKNNSFQWTGQHAAFFGFSPDEHPTMEELLARVHPEDREEQIARFQGFLKGEVDEGTEYRVVWPDGSVHWIFSRGKVYFDADGQPDRYQGITQNIDARKHAEEEIAALNARLSLGMQEIHHRIKNNLQFITALLTMSIMDADGAIPIEDAQRIVAQIQALAKFHDALTREARQDRFGETVSVRAVLETLLGMLEATIGQSIEADIEEIPLSIPRLTALALVMNELLLNAAKYGRGSMQLRVRQDGAKGRLTVSDSGIGFPDGFSVSSHANMGLMLVEQMVTHDLRGALEFANRPEGGAQVTATFPLDPSSTTGSDG